MRLLDTSSLELKEFWDNEIPLYAILSHTWETEEVSFQDMQSGRATSKAGYAKISSSCKQATLDGLKYIWIDTCCIDKSSSAELTEAINSMYRWYQNAQACYAYLSDVLVSETGSSGFTTSRWFTRGWTLQELIAPSHLTFHSKEWISIGTKAELKTEISEITGIDVKILEGQDPQSASVAARMFWASRRVTTRVEDIAYCLMGLFGVNMPLLYGEGENAFIRLQEEIMKISDDHSLFAWTDTGSPPFRGLLAKSPTNFLNARNIVPTLKYDNRTPFFNTNRGLCIELVLVADSTPKFNLRGPSIAVLDCVDSRDHLGPIGIGMQHLARQGAEQFARIFPDRLFTVTPKNRTCKGMTLPAKAIYVQQRSGSRCYPPVYDSQSPTAPLSTSFFLCNVQPFERWTPYN
jgi:hypothetical protein